VHPAAGARPWLEGSLRFGDAMADEWLVAGLLRELTACFAGELLATVEDNDGQFLLIEGAELLPEWVGPDNADRRVLLHGGRLHLVDLEAVPGAGLAPDELLVCCAQDVLLHPERSLASAALEAEVWRRHGQVLAAAGEALRQASAQRCRARVPRAVAAALRRAPQLAALAAAAFCERDELDADMRAALRRGRIPPVPVDEPMLRLPKVAFAHLTQLPFSAPRALSALLSDDAAKQRAAEIGVKLTVGLELLYQRARRGGDDLEEGDAGELDTSKEEGDQGDELQHPLLARFDLAQVRAAEAEERAQSAPRDAAALVRLVDDLCERASSSELALEAAAEDQQQRAEREDDDSWLEVTPDRLEELLQLYSEGGDASGLSGEEADLGGFAAKIKGFVAHESDFVGATCADEDEEEEELDEEELDEPSLDVDKLLGVLGASSAPPGDPRGHGEFASDSDDDSQLAESDTALDEAVDELMREELRANPAAAVALDSTQQHGDALEEVDVDLNLVTNLLRSVQAQGGDTGPAVGLLGQLGLLGKP
jgi:hypothetical protein